MKTVLHFHTHHIGKQTNLTKPSIDKGTEQRKHAFFTYGIYIGTTTLESILPISVEAEYVHILGPNK